jgi:hypothetical protein
VMTQRGPWSHDGGWLHISGAGGGDARAIYLSLLTQGVAAAGIS